MEFQVAREISVNISDTCSSSINQGLKITLNIALLSYAGYRDTAFPGVGLRFRPKFSRDSMSARSQGATYPRDTPFPLAGDLRERRPRDRDFEDFEELDRIERGLVERGELFNRMCWVGIGTLQSLEI